LLHACSAVDLRRGRYGAERGIDTQSAAARLTNIHDQRLTGVVAHDWPTRQLAEGEVISPMSRVTQLSSDLPPRFQMRQQHVERLWSLGWLTQFQQQHRF